MVALFFSFLIRLRFIFLVLLLFVRLSEYLIDMIWGDKDGYIYSPRLYVLISLVKIVLSLLFCVGYLLWFTKTDFRFKHSFRFHTWHTNPYFLLSLLSVSFCIFSIINAQGGFLDYEAEGLDFLKENRIAGFLPVYLNPSTSFFQKIYTDVGNFQARELSHVFDYLDCQFIYWSMQNGYPHFYSFTHYLFTVISIFVLYYVFQKQFKLSEAWSILLISLWLSAPCIPLTSSFFRSAKIGTSLCFIITFSLLYSQLKQSNFTTIKKEHFVLFFFAFCTTLFDRQGYFLILLICAFLVLLCLSSPTKTYICLFIIFLGAVLLNNCYNYLLAPPITQYFNGFEPNYEYQTIPFSNLWLWGSNYDLLVLEKSIYSFLSILRVSLGNIPTMFAFLYLIAVGYVFSKNTWESVRGLHLTLYFLFLVSLLAMFFLMVLTHPSVAKEDYYRIYYPIPLTTVFILLLGYALVEMQNNNIILNQRIVTYILLILCLSNVLSLPQHYQVVKAGTWGQAIKESPKIIQIFKEKDKSLFLQDSIYQKHEPFIKFMLRNQ